MGNMLARADRGTTDARTEERPRLPEGSGQPSLVRDEASL